MRLLFFRGDIMACALFRLFPEIRCQGLNILYILEVSAYHEILLMPPGFQYDFYLLIGNIGLMPVVHDYSQCAQPYACNDQKQDAKHPEPTGYFGPKLYIRYSLQHKVLLLRSLTGSTGLRNLIFQGRFSVFLSDGKMPETLYGNLTTQREINESLKIVAGICTQVVLMNGIMIRQMYYGGLGKLPTK